MKCDYCGKPANLVDGSVIYPHRPDLKSKWFHLCRPCNAYCGCYPAGDGKRPLGRLADAELRAAKQRAHAAIDPKKAHVGMFNVTQCNEAVRLGSNALLWERA